MTVKDRIFDFAQCLIDSSEGKLAMAFNEQDTTNQTDKEAAHFLKYKGKRLGRDLELYAFMNELVGLPTLIAYLLEEIIFPIKKEDRSKICSDYLKEWGIEVNKPENRESWIKLFD